MLRFLLISRNLPLVDLRIKQKNKSKVTLKKSISIWFVLLILCWNMLNFPSMHFHNVCTAAVVNLTNPHAPMTSEACSKLWQQHRSYVLPEWLPEVILSLCNSFWKRFRKSPLLLLHRFFFPLSFLCHLKIIYCLANIFDKVCFVFTRQPCLLGVHLYGLSSFLVLKDT